MRNRFSYPFESGIVRPNANKTVDLAEALDLDPTHLLMLWLQDSLSGHKVKYVPSFKFSDYEKDFYNLVWEFLASQSDLVVEKVTRETEVDIHGNAILKRKIEGLAPRRDVKPISQYVLRERVPENNVPGFRPDAKLDFLDVPEGLAFEYTKNTQGHFVHHTQSSLSGESPLSLTIPRDTSRWLSSQGRGLGTKAEHRRIPIFLSIP